MDAGTATNTISQQRSSTRSKTLATSSDDNLSSYSRHIPNASPKRDTVSMLDAPRPMDAGGLRPMDRAKAIACQNRNASSPVRDEANDISGVLGAGAIAFAARAAHSKAVPRPVPLANAVAGEVPHSREATFAPEPPHGNHIASYANYGQLRREAGMRRVSAGRIGAL